MTEKDDCLRAQEQALVDYLCEEAEIEIESAQELTELGKELRAMEVTARRMIRENSELRVSLKTVLRRENDANAAAFKHLGKLNMTTAALAPALHALVVWDAAYRTGKNEPLVHAFETGKSAISVIGEFIRENT